MSSAARPWPPCDRRRPRPRRLRRRRPRTRPPEPAVAEAAASSRPARRWPSWPRPARSRVGTKFDQPGFGLENLDGRARGLRRRGRQDHRRRRWASPPRTSSGCETPSGRPRGGARGRRGRHGRRDLHDQRRAQGADRLRRAVLRRPASRSWSPSDDDDDHRARIDSPRTPTPRSARSTGSTPSENIREYLASDDQLVLFEDYSECADALENGQVDAVTTDNVILLGFVAESDDAVQAGRQAVHRGALRHRHPEGRRRVLRVHQRRRSQEQRGRPTSRPGRRPPARSRAPRRPSCPSPTSASDRSLTRGRPAAGRPRAGARYVGREGPTEEPRWSAITDNLDLLRRRLPHVAEHLPRRRSSARSLLGAAHRRVPGVTRPAAARLRRRSG